MSEQTHNARLAELTGIAHDLITTYAGLPAIASVDLSPCRQVRAEIEIQLASDATPAASVAAWARELGTQVIFRYLDQRSYVQMAALTQMHGHQVRIWTLVDPIDGFQLLQPLGLTLGDTPVAVDPDRLHPIADRAVTR